MDSDGNLLLRLQRTLPGKHELDAGYRPLKRAARGPGPDPTVKFVSPKLTPQGHESNEALSWDVSSPRVAHRIRRARDLNAIEAVCAFPLEVELT
jgi:hypothetical protein